MKRDRTPILISVFGFLTLAVTWAQTEDTGRSRLACDDIRAIAVAIESYSVDNNIYPGPFGELLSVDGLKEVIEPTYIRRLPTLDSWGHPYRYWSNGQDYLIASTGADAMPDGKWDERLASDRQDARKVLEGICSGAAPSLGADVLFVSGQFCKVSPEAARGMTGAFHDDAERQRVSMGEIRTIATAIESYLVDNNTYPLLVAGVSPVSTLRVVLEPTYIKRLPLLDAWQHPYLYWSNGTSYVVLSTGTDGEDFPYGELLATTKDAGDSLKQVCSGRTQGSGADIVLLDGQFRRWPAAGVPEKEEP